MYYGYLNGFEDPHYYVREIRGWSQRQLSTDLMDGENPSTFCLLF